jgi:hypothetical protein
MIHHFWSLILVRVAVIVLNGKNVVEEFHRAAPDIFVEPVMSCCQRVGITPIGTMAHEFLQAFRL